MRVAAWATAVTGTILFLRSSAAFAGTYYVAPTGSDSAVGTLEAPFATWARAQTAAVAGDTVYFRGGTYRFTAATSTCTSATATVSSVVLSKSGSPGKPIRYWAYPGENPVFDFSGVTDTSKYSCRHVGVNVGADWLHLKGLELKGVLQLNNQNHESWCVYVTGGSNNIFEQLDVHHNMGPGFFLQSGGNNTFLNCDSHENEDTLTSNGDGQSADGFGCHPKRVGDTGNLFHGCRAWWNSDDGWDFINAQEACTVEYSWAWYNGYKPDALSGGQPVSLPAGNGNGIKAGGYGSPQTNVPAKPPQHVVRFNAAFYNKANGLYANHEIVSPFFYNNTSFNNGTDFNMLGLDGTTVTSVGFLRNNLAFSLNGKALTSDMTHGGPISDQFNSWDATMKVTVTAADFQSVAFSPPASCPAAYVAGGTPCVDATNKTAFAGMASARNSDGTLPALPFLRLATSSVLLDRGVDVGLPFAGKAPDLGCFETGLVFEGADAGASSGSTSSVGDRGSSSAGAASASGSSTSSGGRTSGSGSTSSALEGGSSSSGGGGSPGPTSASSSSSRGSSSGSGGHGGASGAGGQGEGGSNVAEGSGCSCQLGETRPRASAAIAFVFGILLVSFWRMSQRTE